jgi:glyoxylase-like metal-dependent hydrolase (beta-lactamase superfamily II)
MTLAGTNTYLYGSGGCTVIDPGPADPGHIDAVQVAAAARGGIDAVLLTHSHGDHADGVARLGAELIRLADGETQSGLRAVATPGHAPDHVCFLTEDGVCFSGDLVLGEGSTFVPPDGGSLAAYMESLQRVRDLSPTFICPGHGPWIADADAKLSAYIEHRLDRERRLLEALEGGERSRAALLDAAWWDVPDEMRGAAAIVMQAHLDKLESEGRLPEDLRD